MNDPIKVFEGLPNQTRARELCIEFERKYGKQPDFVSRAPGRVSIIGEHIDYAGLSVMPAAIEKSVLMACTCSFDTSASESVIRIANKEDARFPAEELRYDPGAKGPLLDQQAHSWVNYFKAGLLGVLGHLNQAVSSQAIKLDIVTDGNVPAGSGLSSSAAMVVASALVALRAYAVTATASQTELAEIAIESGTSAVIPGAALIAFAERLVGVHSGGMDQSASVFSKANHLLNVAFVPKLQSTLVPFQQGEPALSFIIANTLVVSEKVKTAKFNYNLRVVEMRVAAVLLAKHLGLAIESSLPTPKCVMDAYTLQNYTNGHAETYLEGEQRRLHGMLQCVEAAFGNQKNGFSFEEVYAALGLDAERFAQRFHPEFEVEATHLQLYKRIKHAFSEASRVYQYRELLELAAQHKAGFSNGSSGNHIDAALGEQLGSLMNQSQESCRELYNCSCPEIEEVCQIAREAGSLGSRVTGAGFGGATVHLVPDHLQAQVIGALKSKYFAQRFPKLSDHQVNEAVFATKPEEGACLYVLA